MRHRFHLVNEPEQHPYRQDHPLIRLAHRVKANIITVGNICDTHLPFQIPQDLFCRLRRLLQHLYDLRTGQGSVLREPFDHMTNEEEQMLDEALIRTYGKFGITHDNDSVYADRNAVPPKMKTMPILGDLHEELQKNEMTKRIAVIVSRFVTGSAQSFNQQTNVDLSNKYIVLDLSELKGKLLPVGMMIALDYVWDKIKSDRTKKKAIMIDEIWQLIGAGSNRMAAEFCLEIFKVIRGFGGAAISATQDLSDFFGLEDGRYGRAIINNSKNKIILNLEPDEAEFVRDTLKLTKTEIRSITRFERGEALICSNNSKVPVIIKASKEEQEMITTDRAELEAILKERQHEAD